MKRFVIALLLLALTAPAFAFHPLRRVGKGLKRVGKVAARVVTAPVRAARR